ncbi:MAG: (2Fe-2S)-binding protein [Nocardioidaceae bacterium]
MMPGETLVPVAFTVNGTPYELELPARRLLSDALRHDLRLTGTHVGCEHGVCGACTVLVDGNPTRSCLVFAVSLEGAEITTVEGCRAADGGMGPVQQAFQDCHALQCGFCTPGFITTITAFLDENESPTAEESREAISGNLCRCTGYQNIVAAVRRAADLRATTDARSGKGPAGRTGGSGRGVDGPGSRATKEPGRLPRPGAQGSPGGASGAGE